MTPIVTARLGNGHRCELMEYDDGGWCWCSEGGGPMMHVLPMPASHRRLLNNDGLAATIACSDLMAGLGRTDITFTGALVGEELARQALEMQGDRPCGSA